MGRVVAFIPGDKYPSVSITGASCSLMCTYCETRYLHSMMATPTPEILYRFALKHASRGGLGMLVSGGFTREGRLPIEPFLPILKKVKEETGLILSVHPGLPTRDMPAALREAGVDIVDYEIPTSDTFIENVKRLTGRSVEDYLEGFDRFLTEGPRFIVPHITVGLPGATLDDELVVAREVVRRKPYLVVVLVFIPTRGTGVSGIQAPGLERVLMFLRSLRAMYRGLIALGCMRPASMKEALDDAVVREGLVDRIVNPRRSLIKRYGLPVVEACCSVPHELLGGKPALTPTR